MGDYLEAVFAYFGDDEPNAEHLTVLMERIEPTDQEQDDIVNANPDEKDYCFEVHSALMRFTRDASDYIANLSDDNPRKVGLVEIARKHRLTSAQQEQEPPSSVQVVQNTPGASGVDQMLSGKVVLQKPPRTSGQGKDGGQTKDPSTPALTQPQPQVRSNPITAVERRLLHSTEWVRMRTALEQNYASKRDIAESLCCAYQKGQFGAEGCTFGSLIRKCMDDLNSGLNVNDPAEFRRRYYA